MKAHSGRPFALPLPAFVLRPVTALVIACTHVYLAAGHLLKLFNGDVQWTHFWKGLGALAGAYVFAALASRRLVQHAGQQHKISAVETRPDC
jgi:hypothetical protein